MSVDELYTLWTWGEVSHDEQMAGASIASAAGARIAATWLAGLVRPDCEGEKNTVIDGIHPNCVYRGCSPLSN